MLGVGTILAFGVATAFAADVPWYHNAVIYQLYPRSFLDTDGDGIGDLKGVLEKVDYLAGLGISAVWFSPIHPSPNEDFGYDISDFTDINPEYGTLEIFDQVVKAFNQKGIKVLLDFVPNHSSTEHKWFKYSEGLKVVNGTNYTDFYVWKDPKGYDANKNPIPPNNWLTVMNTGSSWKWNEKRKQFYLHNFLEHQADLNYNNPDVREHMADVLTFWMNRGVNGFRVDAVSWLFENQKFPDEPETVPLPFPKDPKMYPNLQHIHTMDQPENVGIVKGMRKALEEFRKSRKETEERVFILESYSSLEILEKYYGDNKEPGATFPFNFALLMEVNRESNTTIWNNVVNGYYNAINSHWSNWVLGNHDQNRVFDRWGEEWLDILHMIMMTLKGTAVTYNGEEIGMEDSTIRWDQRVDLQGIVAGEKAFKFRSRDFERGPMPWNSSHFGGFSSGSATWVPLAPSYWRLNVELQESAERSHLKIYKQLTKLRKENTLTYGDCSFITDENGILYIFRSYKDNPTYVTVINIGDHPATVDLTSLRSGLPVKMNLVVSSLGFLDYKQSQLTTKEIQLPAKSGVVLST